MCMYHHRLSFWHKDPCRGSEKNNPLRNNERNVYDEEDDADLPSTVIVTGVVSYIELSAFWEHLYLLI